MALVMFLCRWLVVLGIVALIIFAEKNKNEKK